MNSILSTFGILFGLFLFGSFCNANPITNLPGYNGPSLDMNSGYINVDGNNQRFIFYWLIKSQGNPAKDPLVFWYQGGPGCSGLGGLFAEHGPITPDFKGGLNYSPISWTTIANVVYLEQPVGVGFSYSTNPNDYNTNDTQSAIDNFAFLEGFLKAYPEYKGRPLWITGESYAGVYVPSLTAQILDHPNSQTYSQFRGLMVGNPCIWCVSVDMNAEQFALFYYHGLVSYSNYANWTAYGCDKQSTNAGCDHIMNVTLSQIGVIYQQLRGYSDNLPSLDPDDLYQDFCGGNGTLDFVAIDPNKCSPLGDRIQTYLNRADVQKAIFANPTNWTECTNNINYTVAYASMIPIYKRLFSQRPDVSVLVYSGDVDIATVPFSFTITCLNELQSIATPVSPWQPWFINGATAGYTEAYKQYTFATLKGAGHEAPQYQPLIGFNLFKRFLTAQNLTSQVEHHPRFLLRPSQVKLTQGSILRSLYQSKKGRFN